MENLRGFLTSPSTETDQEEVLKFLEFLQDHPYRCQIHRNCL